MSETNKISLSLGGKRKKSTSNSNNKEKSKDLQEAFQVDTAPKNTGTTLERNEPLVIPVAPNKLKFQSTTTASTQMIQPSNADLENEQAIRALEKDAEAHTFSNNNDSSMQNFVIPNTNNTFQQRDLEQYQRDLQELPDEIPLESDQYQKVPIHEFGAALLRGMGWTGDDRPKSKDDEPTSLPRPHRLGLGATPSLVAPPTGSRRRPDQVQRDQALQKQQEEYTNQREEQRRMDRQRTLQNGSLVRILSSGERAKIIQLVGVPGLNMVKIQYEGQMEPTVVKRGDLGDLLTRQELHEKPFHEYESQTDASQDLRSRKSVVKTERDARKSDDEKISSRKETRKRDRDDYQDNDSSKRRKEDNGSDYSKLLWVIPRIRVRVVTEKLGRRYFREKGVIVDVTRKGATVRMDSGSVLDRIPERYLETALPKAGGNAIVLTGDHKYAKGQLLERDSKHNRAVLQIYEDMNVLTLKLDDIAEWMGPLDDDLGE